MRKSTIYRITVKFTSSVTFPDVSLDGPVFDPRIRNVHVSASRQIDSLNAETTIEIDLTAHVDNNLATDEAEPLVVGLLGLIGFVNGTHIIYDQMDVMEFKSGKGILHKVGRFQESVRPGVVPKLPIYSKNEHRAFYWIGKAEGAARPDDELSYLYAALEAVMPKSLKYETKCECCDRPMMSEGAKTFLVDRCKLDESEASKIVATRGAIVHGKRSAVTHFSVTTDAAYQLKKGLQNYFMEEFNMSIYSPALHLGSMFRIVTEPGQASPSSPPSAPSQD